MSTVQARQQLTEAAVRRLVTGWYEALDRHAPLEQVTPFLVADGAVLHFPEGTLHGLDAFRGWYETVTHTFFDEIHTVTDVDVRPTGHASAEVKIVVNWQTRVWNPPAPTSEWQGFDAYQTWTVELADGSPRIRTYTVDRLDPMPHGPGPETGRTETGRPKTGRPEPPG